MATFYDFDVQDQDDSDLAQLQAEFDARIDADREETIADMERSGYSDAMDLEGMIAAGFDPWAGLTVEEWAAANRFDLVTS